jgi:hypothetical protein
VILDREAPDPLPDTHLLIFRPDRPIEELQAFKTVRFPDVIDWRAEHALLQAVVFSDVHIAEALAAEGEPHGEVLVRGTGGVPLLVYRQEPGQSFRVVLPFELSDTDWPLRPSFPIFMANVVKLAREFTTVSSAPYFHTGAVISLPALEEKIRVTGPDGRTHHLEPMPGTPHVPFADTHHAGIYAVEWGDDRMLRLAVNMLDEEESDLTPAAELKIGGGAIQGQPTLKEINRDIWPWLAAVILLIALFEWYAFHRKLGY